MPRTVNGTGQREKVRTGRTVGKGKGKNRRAEWALKDLVDKGYVETVPFECDGRGMKHS